MKKRVAITMGEPGGIGPEIILKTLCLPEIRDNCIPIIIGDPGVFESASRLINNKLDIAQIDSPNEAKENTISLIQSSKDTDYIKGRPTSGGGDASYLAIKKAVDLAMNHEVSAVVTAPISKEALKMAGLKWPGHTEMLAELTDTTDYAMMLVGGGLRVILVTIHTSIQSVPALITKARVLKTIMMAKRACLMSGIDDPRIAVLGLNPHAGESGMFGAEEAESIAPAIETARGEGIDATGPYPPDTLFNRARKGEFDIVVCMYHDQGLIPLKLLGFETGVNITVGLPIIRTSPDHGTAYDIAWKCVANPSSMREAVMTALGLRIS